MAKAKNTKSEDQTNITDLFGESGDPSNTIDLNIESLIKDLEDIETKISDGNLSISEQINELNRAKEIVSKVKTMLEDAKSQINIIEND